MTQSWLKSALFAPEVMCMEKYIFVKKYCRESSLTPKNENIVKHPFSSKSYEIHLSRKLFGAF